MKAQFAIPGGGFDSVTSAGVGNAAMGDAADWGDSAREPFISDAVLRRRARRLFMERFEQAFFVGLLLALIAFTMWVVFSEYTVSPVSAASGPLGGEGASVVLGAERWEADPRFVEGASGGYVREASLGVVPDEESYPVVGDDSLDTQWIEDEESIVSLMANPYVGAAEVVGSAESGEDVGAESLEAVAAPAPGFEVEAEAGDSGALPLSAYLGSKNLPTLELSGETEGSRFAGGEGSEVEDVSGPLGVLRVGGGHERDVIRMYTFPGMVYGLEN